MSRIFVVPSHPELLLSSSGVSVVLAGAVTAGRRRATSLSSPARVPSMSVVATRGSFFLALGVAPFSTAVYIVCVCVCFRLPGSSTAGLLSGLCLAGESGPLGSLVRCAWAGCLDWPVFTEAFLGAPWHSWLAHGTLQGDKGAPDVSGDAGHSQPCSVSCVSTPLSCFWDRSREPPC